MLFGIAFGEIDISPLTFAFLISIMIFVFIAVALSSIKLIIPLKEKED